MVILVTGSEGFIGKHLVERLQRDGHEVCPWDRNEPIGNKFDLCNLKLKHYGEVDVVFHLAAKTGLQGWDKYIEYQQDNVNGTYNLLRSLNVRKKFILTSTSSVYGRNAFGVTEALKPFPVSPYGVTKLAQEELCWAWYRTHGLPLTVLRLFSVYGPGQREDMAFSKFIRAAKNGEPLTICEGQKRGVTYIDDVIDALMLTMENPALTNGETYNVGGPLAVTPQEIAAALANVSGLCPFHHIIPPREGDQEHTLADTTKIRQELGWCPKVGFKEGLRRQWEASL